MLINFLLVYFVFIFDTSSISAIFLSIVIVVDRCAHDFFFLIANIL